MAAKGSIGAGRDELGWMVRGYVVTSAWSAQQMLAMCRAAHITLADLPIHVITALTLRLDRHAERTWRRPTLRRRPFI
jgi:hypothetical protein